MDIAYVSKALVAVAGAVAASVAALQTEAAETGMQPAIAAYAVAVIVAVGAGLATFLKSNGTPSGEVVQVLSDTQPAEPYVPNVAYPAPMTYPAGPGEPYRLPPETYRPDTSPPLPYRPPGAQR